MSMFRLTSRLQRDLKELSEQRFTCTEAVSTVDGIEHGDPIKLQISIDIHAGLYAGGHFSFKVNIPHSFPFAAPEVYCMSRIWHPNVCLRTGRVSLSILDEDWRPVISLNTVVFGLQLVFVEPNAELSLNNEATAALLKGADVLGRQVQQTFCGGFFGGFPFSAQRGIVKRAPPGDTVTPAARGRAGNRWGAPETRTPPPGSLVPREGAAEETKGGGSRPPWAPSRNGKRKSAGPLQIATTPSMPPRDMKMREAVDAFVPSLQYMSIDEAGGGPETFKRRRISPHADSMVCGEAAIL